MKVTQTKAVRVFEPVTIVLETEEEFNKVLALATAWDLTMMLDKPDDYNPRFLDDLYSALDPFRKDFNHNPMLSRLDNVIFNSDV